MSSSERTEHLRTSEERFRLLVESVVDYAIFMLDPDGTVATWNVGAERMKGYRASEIIGRHFSCFYPPETVRAGRPEHGLRAAAAEGRYENEGWRVRKDGTRFWADVVITALRGPDGEITGYAKVTRDLTQRKRLDELERASQRMNLFLAMLGHEIRNPLTPIRNAVSLMKASRRKDDVDWCTQVLDRQVEQLGRLVEELLDIGRITSGKIVLKAETLDLSAVIHDAVEPFRPTFATKGLHFELALAPEPIWVRGDPVRLSQIVVNLLDNAIKYTAPDDRVSVATSSADGEAILEVRDTGIGIPADALPNVFDLFSQGGQSFDRTKGGLGIGLAIVRQLAELHGGIAEAASEGAGKGSEFRVRLPLGQGGTAAASR